jgi:hypothetical protein
MFKSVYIDISVKHVDAWVGAGAGRNRVVLVFKYPTQSRLMKD